MEGARAEAFQAEPTEVGVRGMARSAGERVPGVTAVAAPILDGTGMVPGALGLTGPSDEFPAERIDRVLPELRRAAAAIDSRFPVSA